MYTTTEEEQKQAAALQARLRVNAAGKRQQPSSFNQEKLLSVYVDEGANKYVLLQGEVRGETQQLVVSKKGAPYHKDAAQPMIDKMEQAGYTNIQVLGGGRIYCDPDAKKLSIFGFSYSFGQANHGTSREVILEDDRYKDYDVTISDEGY